MNVLLLGAGQQGRVALFDLVQSPDVQGVIAADLDLDALQAHVESQSYEDKVRYVQLDASNAAQLDDLCREKPDVILDLLPPAYNNQVAAAAVTHGAHLVNTNYTTPAMKDLAEAAAARGVSLLPEFGLDPGIDLVLLGAAVRSFEVVESIVMYGSGLPERPAADNPLRYKISWSFEGVLRSYRRAARIRRAGREVIINSSQIFAPENVHSVAIEELGNLEAFPNGNALPFCDLLGLDRETLQEMGRYTLRWPGHCAFWKSMVDLHLLDEAPVIVDDQAIDRTAYLAAALEPVLQYGESERDLALVRIEVTGRREGRKREKGLPGARLARSQDRPYGHEFGRWGSPPVSVLNGLGQVSLASAGCYHR